MAEHDNRHKKIAVVALTRGGKELALKLEKLISGAELYLPLKMKEDGLKSSYFSSLKELTAELFKSSDAVIYIMALGIVVRMIAPHLEDKRTDPAVITIDETAQNVISTLSGHLGGANELSREIANKIGANPVITTATDCSNLEAVDLLAARLNCEIEPFGRLKYANAALVNGKKLNIFSDYKFETAAAEQINRYPLKLLEEQREAKAEYARTSGVEKAAFNVIISNKSLSLEEDELQLIPKNIILGLGCRKNTSAAEIETAVDMLFAELGLTKKSIKKLATIDLKKDEPGLLKFAAENELELEIVSREKIKRVESELKIKKSEFVKKTTGVYAAASPAAILSSGEGDLIIDKRKFSGITLAVFEEGLAYE